MPKNEGIVWDTWCSQIMLMKYCALNWVVWNLIKYAARPCEAPRTSCIWPRLWEDRLGSAPIFQIPMKSSWKLYHSWSFDNNLWTSFAARLIMIVDKRTRKFTTLYLGHIFEVKYGRMQKGLISAKCLWMQLLVRKQELVLHPICSIIPPNETFHLLQNIDKEKEKGNRFHGCKPIYTVKHPRVKNSGSDIC